MSHPVTPAKAGVPVPLHVPLAARPDHLAGFDPRDTTRKMNAIFESLDWLGGVAGGIAVLWGAWKLLRAIKLPSDVLLGKWYGYSYFYDTDGARFYKEIIHVRRSLLLPWRLTHETLPCGSKTPSGYSGPVSYRAPYVFTSAYEGSSGDRTSDVGRVVMDSDSTYNMIVSIHLGNSFEETVHGASAYLWVREALDRSTNENAHPTALEEKEFRTHVSRFIRLDKDHFQILLTPPRRTAGH